MPASLGSVLNNDVLTPARLEGSSSPRCVAKAGAGLACAALLLRTLRTIGMTQSAKRCGEMDAGIVIMLEARRRYVAASRTTPERQWSRLDEIRRYRRKRKSKWPSKKAGGQSDVKQEALRSACTQCVCRKLEALGRESREKQSRFRQSASPRSCGFVARHSDF